jgi:hypothetical protein
MDVNTYIKHQFDNCVNELHKQKQVTYSFNGQYISTLGLLCMYRKGYYYANFNTLQKSIEKMLSMEEYRKKNPLIASIALMYTEN